MLKYLVILAALLAQPLLTKPHIIHEPIRIEVAPQMALYEPENFKPYKSASYKQNPARVAESSSDNVENIVRQAAKRHGINEEYFLRIARCESGLNSKAVNYNYYENGHPSGLFQHISGYWPARAQAYGYPGTSVFDPVANANVTAAMFADGLQHLWECK